MTTASTPSTVLLVEDDHDIRSLLRLRVERLGHHVVEAATGEAAMDLVRRHHPVLIMLDILLPGIDGWEVLRRLRADDEFADTPVMVVSIIDDPDSAVHPPVQGYVLKPFRTAEIDDLAGRLIAERVVAGSISAASDDGAEERERDLQ